MDSIRFPRYNLTNLSARMVNNLHPLESVLRRHASLYPMMTLCDAVKLVYQNEFGGGHLVTDSVGSLSRLQQELALAVPVPFAAESIGNGIVRVMLGGLSQTGYSLEALNRDFIRSAELHTGELSSFLCKLDVLRQLAAQGVFSFSASQLEDYLLAYAQQKYPPVSHSPEYRAAYHPSYRIVLEELLPPAYQTEIGAFWND